MRKDRRLNLEERADAREALDLLEGAQLSLVECVRIALHLDGSAQWEPVTLEQAIDRFLMDCRDRVKRGALRARTVDFYEDHLWAFAAAFPRKKMDELDRRTLTRHFARGSRAQWRAVRALFNWAARQDPRLVRTNPVRDLSMESVVREAEITFLSLDEVEKILAAPEPYRRAFALCLFAGIRPEEISSREKAGLMWQHINQEERLIRIPAHMAKGSRRGTMSRLIDQAPPNLWSWLAGAPESGRVFPFLPLQMTRVARERAGYVDGRPWPHDGLRKTFCTYHVAAFGDVAKTSLIMGHRGSPDMIHRHYRGLATKADGESFFALRAE